MLIEIHPKNPDKRKVAEVVDCLKSGGVIIYPTDTVYSFGCDIYNSKAIEKVARLKGVRVDKAEFSIVCNDLSDLASYSRQLDNHVFKMMKALLPGPYTFILDAGKSIPKIFNERKKTIGIRVPDHHVARDIVVELGNPIIASSVHDDDEMLEYTTDPVVIHDRLGNMVDIVIDSGSSGREASTVVNCADGMISLVRQGKGIDEILPWIQ